MRWAALYPPLCSSCSSRGLLNVHLLQDLSSHEANALLADLPVPLLRLRGTGFSGTPVFWVPACPHSV